MQWWNAEWKEANDWIGIIGKIIERGSMKSGGVAAIIVNGRGKNNAKECTERWETIRIGHKTTKVAEITRRFLDRKFPVVCFIASLRRKLSSFDYSCRLITETFLSLFPRLLFFARKIAGVLRYWTSNLWKIPGEIAGNVWSIFRLGIFNYFCKNDAEFQMSLTL